MNFKEILSNFSIPYKTEGNHCRPGWINIDCPYCGQDTEKFHMGYSIEKHFLNCWRCGSHPLIQTLMKITNSSFHQIKKLLDDLDTIKFEKETPLGKLILPKEIKPLHSAHKKYLYKRGFNWKEIERLWQIKGITISSNLQWRIFIPIIYHAKVVSWTTRTIGNSEPRYITANLNEETIPHKNLLYGEDFARHAIIVVEGVFDAWKIGCGAVSTFGIGYSSSQLSKIAKYPVRAICFDNEKIAQNRAQKLYNDLAPFPGETFNIILDGKDAAEESKKNIVKIRKILE